MKNTFKLRNLNIRLSESDKDAITIERTNTFFLNAQELSDFIKELPLTQQDNDCLISLILKQVQAAEHGAFIHGFQVGIRLTECENQPQRNVLPIKH